MLASILEAAGLRTAAVGNIGVSLLDAVLGDETYDVLAVELSSYQLHWAPSLRAHSGAVLNLAPDHLDWHGSMAGYAADKGRIYEGNSVACVYNAQDAATEDLVREADVEEGCRAIGFTLGTPGPSQLGVVDGILVDRAFVANRQKQAQELAEVGDVDPPAPHNIANALAAAALARAFGVQPAAVRDGLRAFRPDAHRIEHVADVAGVSYIDDSKATNTHAAEASLAAYEPIVWIAGGLAKGATFDGLVTGAAKRLRGVVLMGADRALIRKPWRDTPPRYRWSTSTGPTLGRCPRRSSKRHGWPGRATPSCWPRPAPRWTCSSTTTSGARRSRTRSVDSPTRAPDGSGPRVVPCRRTGSVRDTVTSSTAGARPGDSPGHEQWRGQRQCRPTRAQPRAGATVHGRERRSAGRSPRPCSPDRCPRDPGPSPGSPCGAGPPPAPGGLPHRAAAVERAHRPGRAAGRGCDGRTSGHDGPGTAL